MILSHQVQMVILLSESSFDISIIPIHVVIPNTFRLLKCSHHSNRDLILDQVRLEQSFSPSATCVPTWLRGWRVLMLFKHPVTCGILCGCWATAPSLQLWQQWEDEGPALWTWSWHASWGYKRERRLRCDFVLEAEASSCHPLIWVFKENIFWG